MTQQKLHRNALSLSRKTSDCLVSLYKKVHLYEHIILFAHGFCRSGLLKMLTNKGILVTNSSHRISKPYKPDYNKFVMPVLHLY